MYVVEITFARESRKNAAAQREAVESVLGAWLQEGHICVSEWQVLSSPQTFTTRVLAPAPDAFKSSRCSKYVKDDLKRLSNSNLAQPQIKFLGRDDYDGSTCSCKKPSRLYLFTTFLQNDPPLSCGDCGGTVPLYRIPKSEGGGSHGILSWTADYQACDTLQINCSTGEKFALREMGELKSSLSRRGLEICREVERLTGTPTYYYLHRYRGRSKKSERARLCPSCDGAWLLPEAWHNKFSFRCDKCRLLSNLAY